MLYALHSMDSWIGKEVLEDEGNGGYRDATTGKPLSKKLAASYMAFCKRHSRRCHTGDMVDKYIRLVDKCQPRVFAEAPIYLARFPEQVGDLLKQIKKVRKQIRKARGRRRKQRPVAPSNSGKLLHQRQLSALRQVGELTVKIRMVESQHQRHRPSMRKRGATKTQQVGERRQSMGTDTPPDWGNSSGDEAEPSYSWPWGDSGRPSDRGDSPSHLALRPREPRGRPPPQAQPTTGQPHHRKGAYPLGSQCAVAKSATDTGAHGKSSCRTWSL